MKKNSFSVKNIVFTSFKKLTEFYCKFFSKIVKNFLKSAFLVFFLANITSCASRLHDLAEKEADLRLENYHSSYLALHYLNYSRALLQSNDFLNSEYFAKKGLDSAKGFEIIPENPRYWHAPDDELNEIVKLQKRFEEISIDLVKKEIPIQFANVAFLVDCVTTKDIWPSYNRAQYENCKPNLYKALEEIEYFIANYGKQKTQKTEILEPKFTRHLIFFDFDRYKINDKANRKLVEILNIIDDLNGDYQIILMGNADRSGHNLYNENLSLNRGRAVYQYLRKNGVPKHLMEIRQEGEEFPDIITKNGQRQQYNRTVQLYLIEGANSVRDIPLPIIKNITYRQEIQREKQKRGIK